MRIISIDPGTMHCGVVVWFINPNNLSIRDMLSFTIEVNPNLNVEDRIWLLKEKLLDIYIDFNPIHLAHESAFLNRLRPMAYGPIYTTINVIRKSFIDYSGSFNSIFSYPPKLVKSFVSKGTANKDDMRSAVTNLKELQPFLTGYESEHEIDALAIGYGHILNIRQLNELLLL